MFYSFICLFRYLFISHVWNDKHAFMALFFYELVRDQIVFIWHAWATVVVHRWSLFLSAGPCLQNFFDDGEKRSFWPSDVKDRFELFISLSVYLFVYLFVLFEPRSELSLLTLICLLASVTLNRDTSYRSSIGSLTTTKTASTFFLWLANYSQQCSTTLKPYVYL